MLFRLVRIPVLGISASVAIMSASQASAAFSLYSLDHTLSVRLEVQGPNDSMIAERSVQYSSLSTGSASVFERLQFGGDFDYSYAVVSSDVTIGGPPHNQLFHADTQLSASHFVFSGPPQATLTATMRAETFLVFDYAGGVPFTFGINGGGGNDPNGDGMFTIGAGIRVLNMNGEWVAPTFGEDGYDPGRYRIRLFATSTAVYQDGDSVSASSLRSQQFFARVPSPPAASYFGLLTIAIRRRRAC